VGFAAEVELLDDILGASVSSAPAAPSYGSTCLNRTEDLPTEKSSNVDQLVNVLPLPNAEVPPVGATVDPSISNSVGQGSEGGYSSPMLCDFDFGNTNNRPAYGFIAPQQTVFSLAPSYTPHETHWEGGGPVILNNSAHEERLPLGWTRGGLAAIAEESEPMSDNSMYHTLSLHKPFLIMIRQLTDEDGKLLARLSDNRNAYLSLHI